MTFPEIPVQFENQEYVISVEIRGNPPEGTGRIAYILYLALNELLTTFAAPNAKQIEYGDTPCSSSMTLESEELLVC